MPRLPLTLACGGYDRTQALIDGRVEVFAQGDGENVDRLVNWLWGGPAMAVVVGVESEAVALDTTLRDFFIHPNPMKSN